MKTFMKWTAAAALSLFVHAGAVAFFEPDPQDIPDQVAGGEAMEVTLLGNAFEDTLQAGVATEQPIDPLETPPEEVEPDEETSPVEEVRPIEAEVPAETPSDVQPVEVDVVVPADQLPEMVVAEAEVTATVAPVETVVPEEKPEIQPEPEKVEKPKEKPPEKKVERKKPIKQKTGEKGQSTETVNKGQADGAENAAVSMSSGKKGKVSQQAGNAAVSNYTGKVRMKLKRRLKYPRSAEREGITGVAQVKFTVSTSGAVSNISLVRSAGSSILDQAAIETVNRAAPFPQMPDGMSSRNFIMPLEFGR